MNHPVRPGDLPAQALLNASREMGAFVDCYVCEMHGVVAHADYVQAFYTTPLFKLERFILQWLAGRPSTDADARRLAEGSVDSFSAWRVKERAPSQLLLADITGRTQSWLMVAPAVGPDDRPLTRLYFGSAVMPQTSRSDPDRLSMGWLFHALSGFHRLYSRLLLAAARTRLERMR